MKSAKDCRIRAVFAFMDTLYVTFSSGWASSGYVTSTVMPSAIKDIV